MNRRELLQKAAGVIAASGLPFEAQVIDAEPKPLLMVFRMPPGTLVTTSLRKRLRDCWQELADRHNLPPCIVLDAGMTLECVVNPSGKSPEEIERHACGTPGLRPAIEG